MGDRRKPGKINVEEIDPSVYYYDEVYEEDKQGVSAIIDQTKKNAHNQNLGSKYITKIRDEADLRKTEREIRKFKRYAKDSLNRDGDEEILVSSSYKKRLAEIEQIKKSLKRDSKTESTEEISSTSYAKEKKTASNASRETDLANKSPTPPPSQEPIKKKLITHREKKEYLRKLLAKRTVGKVYLDAINSYKQRKAVTKLPL